MWKVSEMNMNLRKGQKLMADAQLKEIIIEAASECDFLPDELEFYSWLI